MASLIDSLTWSGDLETEIRAYLEVTSGQDATLAGLFRAACRAGDDYMGAAFVDDDGVDIDIETEEPDVILGIKEWMRVVLSGAGSNAVAANINSVKAGDDSVSYNTSKITRVELPTQALDAASTFWYGLAVEPWRL